MAPAMEMVREFLVNKHGSKIPGDFHLRCACHIVHNAVKDSLRPLQVMFQFLRTILKSIRMSQNLREKFRKTQVLLGNDNCKEVPSLDVETRWSSTFVMVKHSYELRDVFEAMCNDVDVLQSLGGRKITSDEWWNAKCVVEFLEPASVIIEMTSSVNNFTISLQPTLYKRLITHCEANM